MATPTPSSENDQNSFNSSGCSSTSSVTVKIRCLLPRCQVLNKSRVDIPVGFDEYRLVRVNVGAKVLSIPEDVAILGSVALFDVFFGLVEGRHHQVHFVALLQEGARSPNLGMHGVIPTVVAAAQAYRIFLGTKVILHGRSGRWVEEQLHANAVRGPDHGLHMELRPAIGRHADQLVSVSAQGAQQNSKLYNPYLHLIRDAIQVQITPARWGPVRKERATNACVHRDEALVLLVQAVLTEDLAKSTEIETCVGSADDFDVVLRWDEASHGRLSIEDENEVCSIVQALANEKLEVLTGGIGFGERIKNQGSLSCFRGRLARALTAACSCRGFMGPFGSCFGGAAGRFVFVIFIPWRETVLGRLFREGLVRFRPMLVWRLVNGYARGLAVVVLVLAQRPSVCLIEVVN